MYKVVIILYLSGFVLYILFSRSPDYFEGEFIKGVVEEKHPFDKWVEYRVGKQTFSAPLQGWGASQVAHGESVMVIYNPAAPTESLYTFFAYWITLPELLTSSIGFIILFLAAVFITGKQEDYYYTEEEHLKKRKYKD